MNLLFVWVIRDQIIFYFKEYNERNSTCIITEDGKPKQSTIVKTMEDNFSSNRIKNTNCRQDKKKLMIS